MSSLMMLVMMFLIFYFLLIRPQQRRHKEHSEFVDALERGKEIVTEFGVYGKVVGLTERVATIEIAKDVTIKVERSRISRYRDAEGEHTA